MLRTQQRDMPPLKTDDFVKWMGGTPMDMQAFVVSQAGDYAGSGEELLLTILENQDVVYNLTYDPGPLLGQAGDFFLVAKQTQTGVWYWYNASTWAWQPSPTPIASHTGNLDHLAQGMRIRVNHPRAGYYKVLYGVDSTPDGQLDLSTLRWDRVDVQVQSSSGQ